MHMLLECRYFWTVRITTLRIPSPYSYTIATYTGTYLPGVSCYGYTEWLFALSATGVIFQ